MNLVQRLIDCGAVKFGDFTLKSGLKSSYYVDIKKASMNASVLQDIAECLEKKLADLGFPDDGLEFDQEEHFRYAGIELGSVPIVVAAALEARTDYLIVRKAPKDHGTMQRIEGDYFPGDEVILFEDVTTTGDSALEAVAVLNAAGLTVSLVLTVVDRQQGAAEKFLACGIPFVALVTAGELLSARAVIEWDEGEEPELDVEP